MMETSGIYNSLSLLAPLLPYAGQYSIAWIIGLLAIAAYIIYSLVLAYHWFRYGLNPLTILLVMLVYFVVSLSLVGTLLTAAGSLSG